MPKMLMARWIGSGTGVTEELKLKLSNIRVPLPLVPPLNVPTRLRVWPEPSVTEERVTESLFQESCPLNVEETRLCCKSPEANEYFGVVASFGDSPVLKPATRNRNAAFWAARGGESV